MTEVDLRLLEAASSGQTDLILQLLEEEGGQRLHSFKDQVSYMSVMMKDSASFIIVSHFARRPSSLGEFNEP